MIGIRHKIVGGLLVAAGLALAGCSGGQLGSTGISEQDAYKIGCPAIDTTLATGSVANKAALTGLTEARQHADPSAETKKWIDAATELLRNANPKKLPKDARSLIVDGCAKHGYKLQNLKK